MTKLPGLRRRGGSYEFRMRVPKDLVSKLGPERVFSHGTGDYNTAKALHSQALADWYQELAGLRGTPPTSRPEDRSKIDAYRLATAYFEAALSSNRGLPETKLILQARGVKQERVLDYEVDLDQSIMDLLDPESPDGGRRVVNEAQRVATEHGIDLDASPQLRLHLTELMHRGMVEIAGRDRAAFLGQSVPQELQLLTRTRAPKLTMGELVERFDHGALTVEDRPEKTVVKHAALLEFMLWYFGPAMPVDQIVRATATKFRDQLNELPSNRMKLYGNARPDDLIARNGDRRYRLMANATQASYLQMASRMFEWAVAEDLLSKNPFAKLKSRAHYEPLEDRRDPFSGPELSRIFSAPIYTGCQDDRNGFSTPGPNIIKASRYWLPLIALFTGMRAGEILQIAPKHVRLSPKGKPYFLLARDMTLKTQGSRREVPIHPDLVRCGFLSFVEDRQSEPDRPLFDDVPVGSDGRASSTWSKRFATFAKAVGVKKPSTKNCFHSFRHSFKDAADSAGMPEPYSDQCQGWSRGKKQGRTYGSGLKADTLAEWMDKVVFDGLDLSHLWEGSS